MKKIPLNSSIFNQIQLKKKFLPPTKFKQTLLLDLDETLIYTDFSQKYEKHDYVYEGLLGDVYGKVGINFRPGLKKFLEFTSKNFEVVLFTSAIKYYADKVLELIDPERTLFSYRLYREDCIDICDYFKIKDLRILGNRQIDNLFLIDNNLINMYSQLNNGYLIPSFYNDEFDNELTTYLTCMFNEPPFCSKMLVAETGT